MQQTKVAVSEFFVCHVLERLLKIILFCFSNISLNVEFFGGLWISFLSKGFYDRLRKTWNTPRPLRCVPACLMIKHSYHNNFL